MQYIRHIHLLKTIAIPLPAGQVLISILILCKRVPDLTSNIEPKLAILIDLLFFMSAWVEQVSTLYRVQIILKGNDTGMTHQYDHNFGYYANLDMSTNPRRILNYHALS